MSDDFARALERVSHVSGVRGALIVESDAGVPVIADVAADTEGDAVAALASSLYRRTARAAQAGGFGPLETLHLEAAGGHVLVAGAGDLLVIVLAEPDAQLALVRLEAVRVAESLR